MGRYHLQLNQIQLVLIAVFSAAIFFVFASESLAQSSLGLGRSEQAITPDGWFAGLLFWIQQQQQAFYKSMTAVLKAMREDPTKVWYLVALSFAYGIFHAAGPGHGKAVVSSYMLANEVAAKRGIMLSFAASFLQGVTAISAITILLLFLRGTGIRTDNLAGYLEITSYFCVMLLGIYLLWRKVLRPGHSHGHAHNHHDHHHGHDHTCHGHNHDDHNHSHHDHHSHVGCNHLHAPDPSQLEGNKLEIKEAWSAILAVGLRPCTGAIVVLTFAFLNGLYVGGIASTFAMSLGTGITVASLALMAVVAKNTALKVAGMQDRAATIHRIIEIGGAALVFLLGLVLFSAAITV